ncbi:hypothetical protein SAMN05216436_115106 [bacterium A37T11]|nr:hypothetical protein SAMN05216436_115106 [bacterium A37T11]
MLSYTQHSLDKLESLLKAMNYRVRYEKGSFKTGACILQASKVVVVNRFSNIEAKIGALLELIRQLDVDVSLLDEKQKQFLLNIKQTKLIF